VIGRYVFLQEEIRAHTIKVSNKGRVEVLVFIRKIGLVNCFYLAWV
jgi:hypothetical protein